MQAVGAATIVHTLTIAAKAIGDSRNSCRLITDIEVYYTVIELLISPLSHVSTAAGDFRFWKQEHVTLFGDITVRIWQQQPLSLLTLHLR
jgi:hypothetical protein